MVRTMDWKPNEELIAWGKEHLGAIPLDGIWSPEGSGVQYRKMGENTFALMCMVEDRTYWKSRGPFMGECRRQKHL